MAEGGGPTLADMASCVDLGAALECTTHELSRPSWPPQPTSRLQQDEVVEGGALIGLPLKPISR